MKMGVDARSPQVEVVCLPRRRRGEKRALDLRLVDVRSQHCCDRARHLVLDGKNVRQFVVIAFGPSVHACHAVDKLHSNANYVAGAAYAAFEHIAYCELAADFPHIWRLGSKAEARVGGDDKELGKACEFCDDVFDRAVREVVVLWFPAQTGKGKNRDRRAGPATPTSSVRRWSSRSARVGPGLWWVRRLPEHRGDIPGGPRSL